MSVSETERYFDKVERTLRADIAAYQETFLEGVAPAPPTTLDRGVHVLDPASPDRAKRINERQDRNAIDARAVRHPPAPLDRAPSDLGRNESGRTTGRSF